MNFKTGDIIVEGVRIEGIETTLEFANIDEFKSYLATQKETLQDIKAFLKADLPEIIKATSDAVSQVVAEAIKTAEGTIADGLKVEKPAPGISFETIKGLEEALEGLTKVTQPSKISIKESTADVPKGFKIAETQSGADAAQGDAQVITFSDYYRE